MDKHSHAGSPFAHLASFPTTSRWSKEVESGRGGVLGVCWSFIQVIVPSGPLLCGEQGGGLAFSGCYKICSLYKPLNPFFLSFCSSPHFDFLHYPYFPCGLFSPLGADVWNGQYFAFRCYLFINQQKMSNWDYFNYFYLNTLKYML